MRHARAALALGLTLAPSLVCAQELSWKPAAAPAGKVTAIPSAGVTAPASTEVPAATGLVFQSPSAPASFPPVTMPISSSPRPHATRTGDAGGLVWQASSQPLPIPNVPSVTLPAPRSIPPADSPPATVPAPSSPPIRPLNPQLSPVPSAAEAASPWSNQVWGTGTPVAVSAPAAEHLAISPVPALPVRHGVLGSPNVTISRDYHFLDLFGFSLLAGDDDTVVLGESAPVEQSYVQFEYLLWWMRQGSIPIVATTGPAGQFGFLNESGTTALLGPGRFGPSFFDGFRVRMGRWFEPHGGHGWDGSFFFLGRRSRGFAVNSEQKPIITRSFFAPNPGVNREFGEQVAFPGQSSGLLTVDQNSFLWGADINLLNSVCRSCDTRSQWFAGFRHLNLDEGLTITEFLTSGPMAPQPVGTQILVKDSFITRNRFYGGQLGWAAGRRRGRFDLDWRFSLAMGVTHQELEINGFQIVQRPGELPRSFVGGLEAVGPNLGRFQRNPFSVVPEVTINLGYMVTPRLRTYVGYNLLYWTNVLRPGEQIDRVIDLTFVPNAPAVPFSGQARPQPRFNYSDLWVQGIQFGMEFRW